jgi:hypothetical protein
MQDAIQIDLFTFPTGPRLGLNLKVNISYGIFLIYSVITGDAKGIGYSI